MAVVLGDAVVCAVSVILGTTEAALVVVLLAVAVVVAVEVTENRQSISVTSLT